MHIVEPFGETLFEATRECRRTPPPRVSLSNDAVALTCRSPWRPSRPPPLQRYHRKIEVLTAEANVAAERLRVVELEKHAAEELAKVEKLEVRLLTQRATHTL